MHQVVDFFTRLVQRVSPKSYAQALGEVVVTRRFLENFSGDQVSPPSGDVAPLGNVGAACLASGDVAVLGNSGAF